MQKLRHEIHAPTPHFCLWWRTKIMGVGETVSSADAMKDSESYFWRTDNVPTVHALTPNKPHSSTMAAGESSIISHTKPWDLTLNYFIHFLKRTRWKFYQIAKLHVSVGNFITTMDVLTTEERMNTWQRHYSGVVVNVVVHRHWYWTIMARRTIL
jgi:hypothetical protein